MCFADNMESMLQFALKRDKEIILEKVKRSGESLQYASKRLKIEKLY